MLHVKCTHTLNGNFGSDVSVTLKVTFDLHSTEWQVRASQLTPGKYTAWNFEVCHCVVAQSEKIPNAERRDSHLDLSIRFLGIHIKVSL